MGGHIIYVARLWRADGGVGGYFPGAEDKFMKLKDKYGEAFEVAAPQ